MMKTLAAVVLSAGAAHAAPESYAIDKTHSQAVFTFDHHGFAPVTGMLGGITGQIVFDAEAPETSTVTAEIPLSTLATGFAPRDEDMTSSDFLDAEGSPVVTFRSTSVKVTGTNRALITGDLTIKDITREVVLDTVLNKSAPSADGTPTIGLEATTTLLRSDFDAGRSAPANSDAVEVRLAIEAEAATGN